MYVLRQVQKKDKKEITNRILGDSYVLLPEGSDNYQSARSHHFSSMGFTPQEYEAYTNPIIINGSGTAFYLSSGYDYYIMMGDGTTFENLSGLVK